MFFTRNRLRKSGAHTQSGALIIGITNTGPRLAIFLFKAICGHSLCWTRLIASMEWRLRRQIARALARQPPATLRTATRHRRAHKLHAPGARAAAPHARAYAYTPVHIHHRARESLPARTTPVLALTQRACHTFHSAACAGDVFHSALNMKEGPLRRQHQLGHPRRFRRCCYLPQPHTDAAAEQKNRATWQMQGTGRGRRDPNLVGGWKRARGHARGRRCGGPGRMGGACRVAHLNEHASGAIE